MEKVQNLWQARFAAHFQDPAEKSLMLLCDPAGHESWTSNAHKRLLGLGQTMADINSSLLPLIMLASRQLMWSVDTNMNWTSLTNNNEERNHGLN